MFVTAMLPPLKTPMCENLSRCASVMRPRLHAAHRKAGHRAVRLIGDGAEVGVDERNEIVDEHLLERAEVERASARTRHSAVRRAGRSRRSVRWPRAGERIAAVFHRDDERLRFSLGDQVVHDQSGVALAAPARFILARAVLQIEHRIALARVLVVIRRRVNESVPVRVARLREVMNLAELAVRHVLERVEVRVLRRNFDRAAPAARAVKDTWLFGSGTSAPSMLMV